MTEFKTQREADLWSRVVVAVAQSSNASQPYLMADWADRAVNEYRKRAQNLPSGAPQDGPYR